MDAVISECGKYRYRLSREVQAEGKTFAFFGINPSTADASIDDPTVKKWKGFSLRNGAARFLVGNVFSYRSTDVRALATVAAEGDEHWPHIFKIIEDADVLIPCWGSREKVPPRLRPYIDDLLNEIVSSGKPVFHFGKTASGDPKHPLMLGYSTPLLPWVFTR